MALLGYLAKTFESALAMYRRGQICICFVLLNHEALHGI